MVGLLPLAREPTMTDCTSTVKLSEKMIAKADAMKEQGRNVDPIIWKWARRVGLLEAENAALKQVMTGIECGECAKNLMECTCPDGFIALLKGAKDG